MTPEQVRAELDVPTIQVLWTCHACGVTERESLPPERRKDQDVVDWMRFVQGWVTAEHELASPGCRGLTFDLKIPVTGNPENDPTVRIGEARRQ